MKRMTSMSLLLLILSLSTVLGCSKPEGPGHDAVKTDLIGQKFKFTDPQFNCIIMEESVYEHFTILAADVMKNNEGEKYLRYTVAGVVNSMGIAKLRKDPVAKEGDLYTFNCQIDYKKVDDVWTIVRMGGAICKEKN